VPLTAELANGSKAKLSALATAPGMPATLSKATPDLRGMMSIGGVPGVVQGSRLAAQPGGNDAKPRGRATLSREFMQGFEEDGPD